MAVCVIKREEVKQAGGGRKCKLAFNEGQWRHKKLRSPSAKLSRTAFENI